MEHCSPFPLDLSPCVYVLYTVNVDSGACVQSIPLGSNCFLDPGREAKVYCLTSSMKGTWNIIRHCRRNIHLCIFLCHNLALFPDIHTLVNFVLKAMNAQRPGNKASHNSSATTSISTTLSYNLYLQSPPHNLYHTPSGL